MTQLAIGCIIAGEIGEKFLAALAEKAITPTFVLRADEMRRIEGTDIPTTVDLIVTMGSIAFVTAEARAKAKVDVIGYHPSLLPKHKGKRAVQDTIAAGDTIAGGSIYRLNDGWDEGDVLAQESCAVEPGDSPGSLWRRDLMPMGVRLMVETIGKIGAKQR